MWRNDHQSVPAGKLSGTICLHNWWDIILQLRLNGSKHCRLPQGWNLAWCRGTLPMIWLIPPQDEQGHRVSRTHRQDYLALLYVKGNPEHYLYERVIREKNLPWGLLFSKHDAGNTELVNYAFYRANNWTKSNATRGNPSNQHLKSYEWINHPGSTLFTF